MATTMQLSDLQAAVLQRAYMVGTTFISSSELTSYINQSYFELYDLLVSRYGDNYYVAAPSQFVTDGTSAQYSLPSDFYKLLGVDLFVSGSTNAITLKPFNFSERNRFSAPNMQSYYGITNLRYRVNGDKLLFTPLPSAGQTVQIWYVPRMTQLAASTDTVDGVSGWTEYIIIDAAIKCLQKEESDCSILLAQKAALVQRIEAMAENRDAGNGFTVSDTQSSICAFGFGGMP